MSDNTWFKQALERIESKVDKIDEKQDAQTSELNQIKVVQASQAVVLEHHVKRTDLAEEHISLLNKKQDNEIKALQNELRPIQRERAMVKGAMKLGGAAIAAIGVLFGFVKWLIATFHFFS